MTANENSRNHVQSVRKKMVCIRTVKPRRLTYASNMSKTYHRQFDSRTVHVQSAAKDHTKYYSNKKTGSITIQALGLTGGVCRIQSMFIRSVHTNLT